MTARVYKPKTTEQILRDRQLKESLYYSNPDAYKLNREARRAAKDDAGVCIDCPAMRLPGATRCRKCSASNRRSERRTRRARNAAERREIASYRPLDEVTDLNRVRILRAAKMLDWFSGAELNEILGAVDYERRNTTTQMLSRLTKAGRFERREVAGVHDVIGSPYEYRITAVGLDEFERALGAGRRLYSRRAA